MRLASESRQTGFSNIQYSITPPPQKFVLEKLEPPVNTASQLVRIEFFAADFNHSHIKRTQKLHNKFQVIIHKIIHADNPLPYPPV